MTAQDAAERGESLTAPGRGFPDRFQTAPTSPASPTNPNWYEDYFKALDEQALDDFEWHEPLLADFYDHPDPAGYVRFYFGSGPLIETLRDSPTIHDLQPQPQFLGPHPCQYYVIDEVDEAFAAWSSDSDDSDTENDDYLLFQNPRSDIAPPSHPEEQELCTESCLCWSSWCGGDCLFDLDFKPIYEAEDFLKNLEDTDNDNYENYSSDPVLSRSNFESLIARYAASVSVSVS